MKIVGIGASAGGLEALETFFEHVPLDTGLAFVVIQHLSPDYKSFMKELLSKRTKLNITHATHGEEVVANTIYLIPPKKLLTIVDHQLHLSEPQQRFNLPIDIFFRSLAVDQQEDAIGIVLSGTGTDGSLGIREIKGVGGMVIVQDPEQAKFDGMPRSAIGTGLVDLILPTEKMIGELLRSTHHKPNTFHPDSSPPHSTYAKIMALTRLETGCDFSNYRPTTITRRIERRMSILQLDTLEDYHGYIQSRPEECHVLYKEALIGVTNFFRNQEAFMALQEHGLPLLYEDKQDNAPIRVWVAGCSTGEEAYSLAMLFHDYNVQNQLHNEIKIFATDLSQESLDQASAGLYPENIAADVPSDYLKKYFKQDGERYRVRDFIRRSVVFARHDLNKDPPFSNLDLISCRNLLIYFHPHIQKRAFSQFHFALRSRGLLFLGINETAGDLIDLFEVVHSKWKIYRQKGDRSISVLHRYNGQTKSLSAPKEPIRLPSHRPLLPSGNEAIEQFQQQLLDQYMPPTVLINEKHTIVKICNDVTPYIQLATGKATLDLHKMIHKDLSVALGSALHRVRKTGEDTVYNGLHIQHNGERHFLNLTISSFMDTRTQAMYYSVSFHPVRATTTPATTEDAEPQTVDDNLQQLVRDLEQELQFTKENLQAHAEELETTNEELQATNEELLASNEELQSTNEELQSLNEELHTINTEYHQKLLEMQSLNNDLSNLMESTNIGTLFLDRELLIRKYTPKVRDVLNVIPTDIGRPLNDISFRLNYPELLQDAQKVLVELQATERDIQDDDGHWFSIRIQPYRTNDAHIKGLVITFIDVTELKKAHERLNILSLAIEQSPSIVMLTDTNGTIEYVNRTFCEKTGYTTPEVMGKNASLLNSGATPRKDTKAMWKKLKQGERWEGEFHNIKKTGSYFIEQATILPIREHKQEITHYLKTAQDVTEQRQLEQKLRGIERESLRVLIIEDEREYSMLLKVILHGLSIRHVTVLEDGDDAISYIQGKAPYTNTTPPDVIFLDIRLPKYDGFELLEEIRNEPTYAKIPVLIMTSMDKEDLPGKAFHQHANAFIQKPFDTNQIVETLSAVDSFDFVFVRKHKESS